MVLPIYVYGADVLRKKAEEANLSDPAVVDEIKKLIPKMWETMEKADGVGLAAPQVGISIRLLIVDGSLLSEELHELKDFKRVMINPVVLEESEETIEFNEGCLSIPDVNASIERPKTIKVSYIDDQFNKKEELLDNFACRMVQHELDHLDGILFTDRAAPIRKKILQSKLNNIKNGKVKPDYIIHR